MELLSYRQECQTAENLTSVSSELITVDMPKICMDNRQCEGVQDGPKPRKP